MPLPLLALAAPVAKKYGAEALKAVTNQHPKDATRDAHAKQAYDSARAGSVDGAAILYRQSGAAGAQWGSGDAHGKKVYGDYWGLIQTQNPDVAAAAIAWTKAHGAQTAPSSLTGYTTTASTVVLSEGQRLLDNVKEDVADTLARTGSILTTGGANKIDPRNPRVALSVKTSTVTYVVAAVVLALLVVLLLRRR